MDSATYSTYQHRHNFAVWAGARATQRGFTTTGKLRDALESTSIKDFVDHPCGQDAFGEHHRQWCTSVCSHLSSAGVENATYGRAAKLVAVYLKSMVVLPDLGNEEVSYVHPPIDRTLLQSIARDPEVGKEPSKTLRNTSWTKLSEEEYFDLISILSGINGDRAFWKLEEHWSPVPTSS